MCIISIDSKAVTKSVVVVFLLVSLCFSVSLSFSNSAC